MKRNSVTHGLQPGMLAPEFQLKDTRGQQAALADYRGKTVVLVFTRGFA